MGKAQLLPAADYLRHLLNSEYAYRGIWEARARRAGGSPNVAAVSAVLAEYHWQHEYLLDDDPPASARSYKDRVSRALAAESFTPDTARLFGQAFRMRESHVSRLVHLVADPGSAGTISATGLVLERPFRTVSLHELHWVGDDRKPVQHRTIHAIQALQDGVDSYPYGFDTPHVRVEGVQGAVAGPVESHPDHPEFWCSVLRFPRPMRAGEFRFFEYLTTFDYPEPPLPELRRCSQEPLQTLSLRVAFSPGSLPQLVERRTWEALDGYGLAVEPLELDADNAAFAVIEQVPAGVIHGITWVWP